MSDPIDTAAEASPSRDPLGEGLHAAADLSIRKGLRRTPSAREQLAQQIYERLHPVMAALGVLFLVLVLAQGPAPEGTVLQRVLLSATWTLWAVFLAEYLLRLVIAPETGHFLRRTWWQIVLLLVPLFMLARAFLLLRVARPTRVALAALRGGRSARATLTGRAGWLAVVTAIIVFAGADVHYSVADLRPYGAALHATALSAITGEPAGSDHGIAQLLDVVLALYAVVFFATLAGILAAFFLEKRRETTPTDGGTGVTPDLTIPAPDDRAGDI